MKETKTINLNGQVYHIDNDAYAALEQYLEDIKTRLSDDERDDVMTDLEVRIAELIGRELFAKNTQVVTMSIISAIRAQIGAPDEFGENKRPVVKKNNTPSGCRRVFIITLKVLLILLGIQFLIPLIAVVSGLTLAILGVGTGVMASVPIISSVLLENNNSLTVLVCVSAFLTIAIPMVMIVWAIISHMRNHHGPSAKFWIVTILLWVISLIGLVVPLVSGIKTAGEVYIQPNDATETSDDSIALDAFRKIDVNGPVHLKIGVGTEQEIDYCSHNYQVSVKDSVLHIQPMKNLSSRKEINIRVRCLDTILVNGASKVEIKGKYPRLTAEVNGASKLDTEEAEIGNLHIVVHGASKAELGQTDTLWAQAAGASKIEYEGSPILINKMAIGASAIVQKQGKRV